MEDQELKVLASKVRETAKKCSTANGILRQLFPDAFPVRKYKQGQWFIDGDMYIWVLTRTGGPTFRLINIFTGAKSIERPLKGKTIKTQTATAYTEEYEFEFEDDEDLEGLLPVSIGTQVKVEWTEEGPVYM